MSETFVIGGFETKTGTTQKGKAWTLWILKSATGEKIGGTFDAAIGNTFPTFVGSPAEVDREQDDKGYQIKAIRPSAGGHTPAPAAPQGGLIGAGGPNIPTQIVKAPEYFKPRDPKESRSIRRQVALKAAADVCSGRDIGSADVIGLAETFDAWLAKEPAPGELPSDQVPF